MSYHAESAAHPLNPRRERSPLWMLALLAIGFGPLLGRWLLDDQLASVSTQIVNSFGLADSRSGIHLVRIGVRFVLPACLAFVALGFTPLGKRFAFTPLALLCLALADSLMVLNLVDQLRLFVLNGYPSVRLSGDLSAAAAMIALAVAGVSLALSTAWYRSDSCRRWLSVNGRRWFRET